MGRKIFNKEALQEELAVLCAVKKIKVVKMIRAVVTRWNTHGEVIARALELRPALDAICKAHEKEKGKSIAPYLLTPNEWLFLQQLTDVCRVSHNVSYSPYYTDHLMPSHFFWQQNTSRDRKPL